MPETESNAARYDHEARVWRDVKTGTPVESAPDHAWIAGGIQ